MKLIKCHIENFGKLNNQDFVFNERLTSFIFANGYGKSTLVSFIKAMLYGLRGVRANTKEFEDRQKYYPFSGGVFGGTLTLLHQGREYTIERSFDAKSETRDTLLVYSAGELTDALGEDIGRGLTGLDAESFSRVMLMNSTDTAYGGTGDISARLWGSDADTDGAYEPARARLDARKKQLRAARGKGGEISQLDEQIINLSRSIENSDRAAAELDFYYKEKQRLTSRINELEEKKLTLDAESLVREKKKTYAFHLGKVSAKRAEIERISELYPCGVLSDAREREIKSALGELERVIWAKSENTFNERKQTRLNSLAEKFEDTARAEADLAHLKSVCEKYGSTKDAIEKIKTSPRHAERFDGRVPTEEQIAIQKQNAEKYDTLKSEAEARMSRGGISCGALLFGAALLLLASGVGFFFILKIVGIILLAAGALTLSAAFLFKPKSKKPQELLREADLCEAALQDFLYPLGYNTDDKGSARFAFKLFLAEFEEYRFDTQQNKERETERVRLYTECEILNGSMRKILYSYGCEYPADTVPTEGAELLARELSEYKALVFEREEIEKRSAGLDAEASSLLDKVRTLIWEYTPRAERNSLSGSGTLEKIRELTERAVLDRAELTRYKTELPELIKTAEDYRFSSGLAEMSEADAELILIKEGSAQASTSGEAVPEGEASDIFENIRTYRAELARINQEISTIEADVEAAEEQKRKREAAEERRCELIHEYNMLDAAIGFLDTAEHTLSEKYIAPLRDKFISYASRVKESIGEKYTMDKSFNIRFTDGGMSRDERHLSQGQHAIISLSLKLSLIDAMYGTDGFIMLDDPFASLDESNFKKMQALIKTVSKDRQIVYFSCHNSRKI